MSKEAADYKLTLKVQNANLYRAIKEAGYKNVSDFAKTEKINATEIYNLMNFKISPVKSDGSFRSFVHTICEALGNLPEDLFSEDQMFMQVESNKIESFADKDEVMELAGRCTESLESSFFRGELSHYICKAMAGLTEREKRLLDFRFGLNGCDESTLEETGKNFGISAGRARQIEAKALRKLRHPSKNKALDGYLPNDGDCRL